MISRLPPVGQHVPQGPLGPPPTFPGFQAIWLESGTAALALALQAALACRAPAREVILPAYGCPDLVAATVFAGWMPVLVDCHADDPCFNLAALEVACSERTAAVVAVNFLGIRERLAEIRGICERRGAILVEDCAQWFPEGSDTTRVDARILSFGRGKPVNLLGGGCLLLPVSGLLQAMQPEMQMPSLRPLSARVFNALLSPFLYGLISRIPQLHIGDTRFHPLSAIRAMDPERLALADAAISAWTSAPRWREGRLNSIIRSSGLEPLPQRLSQRVGRLLRYPVLAPDEACRDAAVRELAPWGASPFYGRSLPFIPGISPLLPTAGALPGARAFAARLLTLPTHAGLTEAHMQRLEDALSRLRERGVISLKL
jgi:hypothetical protein